MTPEEYATLPPSLAAAIMLRILPASITAKLADIEKPEVPRPPRYDMRISRKGGYQWASETDLESLQFWRKLAAESADGGGEYAEKDAKKRDNLDRWIAFRTVSPSDVLTLTRGDEEGITAAAPSGRPVLQSWDDGAPPAAPTGTVDPDDVPF